MALTRRGALVASAIVVASALLVWLLFIAAPRWWGTPQSPAASAPAEASGAPAATRHIKVTLFYLAEDGLQLQPTERDVPYGEGTLEQARRIVEAQLAPAPEPLTSTIPASTALRDVFLGAHGEAYVDLSPQVSSGHPGGTLNEILTVYTIVHALTANLPAISAVQILVNGHAVDTLAGHVDLRRPLPPNLRWIRGAAAPDAPVEPSRQPGPPSRP
jgi:hypothetical protein